MNKVKKTYVSFENIKYAVNERAKVVTCIIKAVFNKDNFAVDNFYGEDFINKLENRFPEILHGKFTVIGVAKCHPNDEFNEILGKRIAESKAKADAFNKVKKYLDYSTTIMKDYILNLDTEVKYNCMKAANQEINHIKYLLDKENR